MYTAHVCFYVCCSNCVGVICCVAPVVKDSVFLALEWCKWCDGCCVFCLYCDVWSCRCSCMRSMSVLLCRCCMFVSCVHSVAVINAEFCITCGLFMLVDDVRNDHMEEAYSRAGL